MDDKEARAAEHPKPVPVAAPAPATPGELNASYLPFYRELVVRGEWSKSEFNALAAKFTLMPTAAIDVINAWADDSLGDFLIDGNDPVIIHTELLPQPT
jgi:hypothetical protein